MTDTPIVDENGVEEAPEEETKPEPVPVGRTVAYRCPACLLVVQGTEEEGQTAGDYFCRTHNEVMQRALIDDSLSVEEAFPPPVSETPATESEESSESPQEPAEGAEEADGSVSPA